MNKTKNFYFFWGSLGLTFFISLIVVMSIIIWVMTDDERIVAEQDCSSPTPSITIINQLPWDWKQATMPGTFPTITPLIPKGGSEGN